MSRRRWWNRSNRNQWRGRQHLQAASSSIVEGGNPANPDAVVERQQDWQRRMDQLIDSIPEPSAAASYVHNSLSRVTFKVECPGNPIVERILNRQLEPLNAGRLAENLFRIGEAVLSYEYDAAARTTRWWDYSLFEYEATESKAPKVKNRDGKWEQLPAGRKAFRVWRPDSKNRHEAFSNHKSLQDVLEALYIHQLADTTVATSRLAGAGIFYIPNDDLEQSPSDTDEPEPGTQQDMARNLALSMVQSITNRKAADAIVPYLMFGAAANAAGLRHVLAERADDAAGYEKRIDTYRKRYASGVDLPNEVVLGLGQANHWTAWKVDENTWTYYLAPLAQLVADAVGRNFAEPVANGLGHHGTVKVVADGTQVIAKPDRSESAIKLRGQGVITKEAAAKANGFDEDDVEHSFDPVAEGRMGPRDSGTSVATGQRPPSMSASAAGDRRKLSKLAADLMDLEARTHDRYRRMLEVRVPAYLKAQQRQVTAASRDPEGELRRLADQAKLITAGALDTRIRILTAATGAAPDEVLARYEALVDRRAQAVAQASTSYATHVSNLQTTQKARDAGKLGAFDKVRTPPAVVGGLMSMQNGGREAFTPDYTEMTEPPATFADDELVSETLADAEIEYVTKYRWVRGDPAVPFEPHVDLEGAEWTDFAEAETAFLGNAHLGINPAGVWFPGDHVGCQCEYEITFEPA